MYFHVTILFQKFNNNCFEKSWQHAQMKFVQIKEQVTFFLSSDFAQIEFKLHVNFLPTEFH